MPQVQILDADITDEIERGGPAFGEFVRRCGEAVAAAQSNLDANLADTAEQLSRTNIKVVGVFEQQIADDGTMTAGNPVLMELPLINYLMPTAYQWTRLFLQADLKVAEFNGANGFNIQQTSSSTSARARAGYGLTGFGASGGVQYQRSSYSVERETEFARDSAAGTMHMEATLEPRSEIALPRPYVLQKGPRLRVLLGSREDVKDEGNRVVGRKVRLTAVLHGVNGAPLAGKTLEYAVSDPMLDYRTITANGVTAADGKFEIEVVRQGGAFDATKPLQAVVRVWMGLVAQEIGINL